MDDLPDAARMSNVFQVAQLLGVHPTTVRRWANLGLLPSYALGPRGIRRFRQEDIDRFLAKQRLAAGTGHKQGRRS